MMDLSQLLSSQDVNWSVWTLILTAPIQHSSLGNQIGSSMGLRGETGSIYFQECKSQIILHD